MAYRRSMFLFPFRKLYIFFLVDFLYYFAAEGNTDVITRVMVQATSLDLKLFQLRGDGNSFLHTYTQKHSLKDLFEKLGQFFHVDQQNEQGRNVYDRVRDETTDNWLTRCLQIKNNQGYTFLAAALNNIQNKDDKNNEQMIVQGEEDLTKTIELMALIFGEEMISKLCEKSDNDGNSLAHLAVQKSLTKLLSFILLKTDGVHKIFNKDGYNPFHLAVRMDNRNVVRCFKDILKKIPEIINIRMSNKETALHLAAQCGGYEVLSELIKYGGDLSQQDEDSHTPLHDCLEEVYFEGGADDEEKCQKFIKVWTKVVDKVVQWWCLKQKLTEPLRGSTEYRELQCKDVYILRSCVKNRHGLSVLQFAADRGLVKCVQTMLFTKDAFVISDEVISTGNEDQGRIIGRVFEVDVTNLCPEYYVPNCILDRELELMKVTSMQEDSVPTQMQQEQEVGHEQDTFMDALVKIQPPNIAGKILESMPMVQLTEMQYIHSRLMYNLWMIIHISLMGFATAEITAYDIDSEPVLVAFILIYSFVIITLHSSVKLTRFWWQRQKTNQPRLFVEGSIKRYHKAHEKDVLIFQIFSIPVIGIFKETIFVIELLFTGFAWTVCVSEMFDFDTNDCVWIKGYFLLFGWFMVLIPMTSIGPIYKLISVLVDIFVCDLLPWTVIYASISIGFATAINLEFQQLPSNSTCVNDQPDLVGFLQGT